MEDHQTKRYVTKRTSAIFIGETSCLQRVIWTHFSNGENGRKSDSISAFKHLSVEKVISPNPERYSAEPSEWACAEVLVNNRVKTSTTKYLLPSKLCVWHAFFSESSSWSHYFSNLLFALKKILWNSSLSRCWSSCKKLAPELFYSFVRETYVKIPSMHLPPMWILFAARLCRNKHAVNSAPESAEVIACPHSW